MLLAVVSIMAAKGVRMSRSLSSAEQEDEPTESTKLLSKSCQVSYNTPAAIESGAEKGKVLLVVNP